MLDKTTLWYVIIGLLFTLIGAFQSVLKRMPLTTAMIYLPIGYALGTHGLGLIRFDTLTNSRVIERIAEFVVIISLFTSGLKLRSPLRSKDWVPAFRLATFSMVLTVAMIAVVAVSFMDFSWGLAILLGAILAPTDPVLASDVQVRGPTDRDPLRFSLTGEAGMNDGTAFPLVMLGLGLLGLHEIGVNATRWLALDFFWATIFGLAIGGITGTLIARFILNLRKKNQETAVLDDFLTIGLICLSYGLSLILHANGFLAVFAAGLALRRAERLHSRQQVTLGVDPKAGPDSEAAPAQMAKAVLTFNEQLERLGEVGTVLLVGAMLDFNFFLSSDLIILPILFLGVRPLAVLIGLLGVKIPRAQRGFISWFGIRGIGSIYYLCFAVSRGVEKAGAERLVSVVISAVAISILFHGFSVTPFMDFYQVNRERYTKRRTRRSGAVSKPTI